jgi:hypothetical protein
MWPKTNDKKTGKEEKVKLINMSLLSFNRNKISVMACSDSQIPIQFDIVYWQDTLAAINIKSVREFVEGIDSDLIFKHLNLK